MSATENETDNSQTTPQQEGSSTSRSDQAILEDKLLEVARRAVSDGYQKPN
jgi:hypothetical protein